jgi:sporulation and spore germination protein
VKRACVVALTASALAVLLLAGACKKKSETPANVNAANKVAVRDIRLFYESAQMLLVAEPRKIPLPESSAAAIPVVVRELMKGPAAQTSLRLFPSDAEVRGAYLLPGGTVIVDLGGPTLTQGWGTGSHQELMAIASLAQTVTTNFAEARRVRIVLNGAPAETLAGHIALSRSFEAMNALVEQGSR